MALAAASGLFAALGRLASVDEKAAAALRNLAMPSGLPEAAVKQVKTALEGHAAPLAKEAKVALKQCKKTAKKLKVLSEAGRSCLGGNAPTSDPQAKLAVPTINRRRPRGAKKLQRKLARKPTHLKSITKLGRLYLGSGDPYMARMIVGKGLEIKETAALLNMLGTATARLGDYQEAFAIFAKALKRDSSYGWARANRAALLIKFGYRKAARKEARKVRNRSELADGDPELLQGAMAAIGP